MSKKKKSFWATVPGFLTAIAAVITAISGLYVALNRNQNIPQPPKSSPPEPVFTESEFKENSNYTIGLLYDSSTKEIALNASSALMGAGYETFAQSKETIEEQVLNNIPEQTVLLLVGEDVPTEKISSVKNILLPYLKVKRISVCGKIARHDSKSMTVAKKAIFIFL